MNIKKHLSLFLAALMILCLFAGCGSAAADLGDNFYYSDSKAEAAPNEVLTDSSLTGTGSEAQVPNQNQKLIRTIHIYAETEDMDSILTQVNARIQELGGYIEEQSIYNGSGSRTNRHANLTIRIPAESLDQFVNAVSDVSNITSKNETTENITLTYVATESRMKALQTEQDRLLELLAMAENMEDLLQIEARLTDVRSELEQDNSMLRLYDNQVSYGTIHLNLDEVIDYTVVEAPKGFFQRIGSGFVTALKNTGIFLRELAIFLVIIIPYLAIPAVVLVITLVLIKRCRKKKKANLPETTDTPKT